MSELDDLSRTAMNIAQSLLQASGKENSPTEESIRGYVQQAAGIMPGGASAVDVDGIVQELLRRYAIWVGQNSTITDNADHEAWLNAARKRDWRYWTRYREMLEKRYPLKAVDALDVSTDDILGLLEDPQRPGSWDRRGLAVGHIQSGKTSNYTGLVCKAADAGYKIIIVLAGMHNNLRSQTQIRLEEGFLGYETSDDLNNPALRYVGVGESGRDWDIHPNCATNRSEDGDFNTRVARNLAITPEQRPWLFVLKKNKTVLERLLKWVRDHVTDAKDAKTGRQYVGKLPLLLIDDEADNASVDTAMQAFDEEGKPDPEYDPKAINSRIRKILHSFAKVAYVGYTATPFANVFIHRQGWTEEEGLDLFPKSFIINLAAPSNYIGPVRMFGITNQDASAEGELSGAEGEDAPEEEPGLPLAREVIDAAEWVPAGHKKTLLPRYSPEEALPPSLRQAVQAFLLACAAREVRGQDKKHSSMLVHVTRFQDVQNEVHRQVRDYVMRLRQRLTRNVDAADLLEQLRTLWEEDFVKTSAAMAEKAPDLGPYPAVAWEQIRERLGDVASDISVRAINGKAGDILDYAAESTRGLRIIAIGGDKLSRGLTLEGLCISYFLRPSKMYDTLMQMGRWFGFRPGYLDLCRLYSTQGLLDGFCAIAQASEELRGEFELMRSNGATPEQYGMRVRVHPGYGITSPMKMRKAANVNVSFSGTLVETAVLHTEQSALEANLDAASRLLHVCGEPKEGPQIVRQRGGKLINRGGWLWQDVCHEHIEKFFGDYVSHPEVWQISGHLLRDFVRAMVEKKGQLTHWTVFLAEGGKGGSPFEFSPRLRIEHMVRRTASRKSDAGRYMLTGRRLATGSMIVTDETIDLSNEAWEAALALTRLLRTSDPGRLVDGKELEEPTDPSGPAIRAKRPLEKGLLLLYPLDPKQAKFEPGFGGWDKPIMAFAASFPASNNTVAVSYAVDHLSVERWNQELGEVD